MKNFRAKRITALITALALITVGGVYATWSYTSTSGSDVGKAYFTVNMSGESVTGQTSYGSYTVDKTVGTAGTIYLLDQLSDALSNLGTNGSGSYSYIVLPKFSGASTSGNYIAIVSYMAGSAYGSSDSFTYVDLDELLAYYRSTSSTTYTCNDVASAYNAYTAAMCISNGAQIKITFTSSEDSTTDNYQYGIYSMYYFDWDESTSPVIPATNAGTYYYYDSTSGVDTDIFNLDESAKYIFNTQTSSGSAKAIWGSTTTNGTFTYTISAAELASYMLTTQTFVFSDYTAYDAVNTVLKGTAGNLTFTVTEAGTPLSAVTSFALDGSGNYTITDSNNTTVADSISCYRIGFFETATSGSPIYEIDVTSLSGSISDIISSAFAGGTMEARTYYMKVRVIPNSTNYGNSPWSSVAGYKVTVSYSGSYSFSYATVSNTILGV